jgi:drug/metabolite transporter (DMT)-like permease
MALGAQLKGPWLYLAFIFGILATVFTQIGFWRDRALIVVPTYTSLTMMTPAIMEYLVFGFRLDTIQYASLIFIVLGVVILCSGTPEAVLAGDFSAVKGEEKS